MPVAQLLCRSGLAQGVASLADVVGDEQLDALGLEVGMQGGEHLRSGHVDERDRLGIQHHRAHALDAGGGADRLADVIRVCKEEPRLDAQHHDARLRSVTRMTAEVSPLAGAIRAVSQLVAQNGTILL